MTPDGLGRIKRKLVGVHVGDIVKGVGKEGPFIDLMEEYIGIPGTESKN